MSVEFLCPERRLSIPDLAYPTAPDQGCAQTHLARGKKALDVCAHFTEGKLALAVRRYRTPSATNVAHATSLHCFDGERALAVVLLCDKL
jgi:hypothetical protein